MKGKTVQIRGFGVYTSAEVFNEVMDTHFKSADAISEQGKVQIARSIGVGPVLSSLFFCDFQYAFFRAFQ